MQNILIELQNFFGETINSISLRDVIDILIVAIVIYQLLKLTKRTRATQVIKGLLLVIGASLVAGYARLQALSWMLNYVLSAGAVMMVVLFQPELRGALERVGRSAQHIVDVRTGAVTAEDSRRIADELTRAMSNLSRRKVGALIVVEQKTGLNDIIATGTLLHADITSALLENIFEPNTPLHDGAVVIRGGQIIAAGCFLPLTESGDLSRELGTRHRAAIGVTERSDCVSLIVSEETGVISTAKEGRLTRYLDRERLRELLGQMFAPHQPELRRLAGIFGAKRGDDNGRR